MNSNAQTRLTNPRSLGLIVLAWLILQIGGLFSPGLLDDVDSIYIEIAREMLHRHNFVTPYIDGIRFFDKPPLMYWLAAAFMRVFGEVDWAARLPLALAMLALLFSTYALGLRFFAAVSPARHPDRGALYAALAFATAIGPYLYTRFFIPDILICLWMTLGVHLFLIALDRAAARAAAHAAARAANRAADAQGAPSIAPSAMGGKVNSSPSVLKSPLLPSLAFAAVLALNLLTKGLIGLVFPLGFVLLYLLLTRQFRLLPRLHLALSGLLFLAIALPWHILAALRNPAIAMPPGLGLPARAGWAWFYLYNEHFARFLGERIPHDYGNTPRWLFWLYAVIWMMPWAAFLPAAIAGIGRDLGHRFPVTARRREAALTLTLWALVVLVFFTLSHRQEYYSLPALPALALMSGGLLARADHELQPAEAALACHRWILLPLTSLIAAVCGFFAILAPRPAPGTDLVALLATNPELYNLSLGHIFDLTGAAMGLFRGPLTLVALGMIVIGPFAYVLRRRTQFFAANLAIAAGMTAVLLAAHTGLVRFNPILGSKSLALAILSAEKQQPQQQNLILLDGELTSGSSLLFYTRQPVSLVDGRVNGPWFGSFWPDSPHIFEDDASLRTLWAGPRRIFLMTPVPASRAVELAPYGPVERIATAGGKTILSNR
jgi:4-amino-4-deoxy-L-arabinose transferase-like glycosyltransferase